MTPPNAIHVRWSDVFRILSEAAAGCGLIWLVVR